MRVVGSLIALVASLVSLPAAATDTTTTGQPLPPPEQHTVVRGTLPKDLAGRWVAVGWIELPGGRARTTPTLWEIKQDDQLALTIRFAALPPAQQKALDDANTADQRWQPSPADLAQLAAAWDTLPASDPRMVSIETEIVGHDGFDQSLSSDAKTRDAAWAVRQLEQFHPSASPTIKTINVYAALEPREGGYFGNYARLTDWAIEPRVIDGQEVLAVQRNGELAHLIAITVDGDRITAIRDYFHVPYLLRDVGLV